MIVLFIFILLLVVYFLLLFMMSNPYKCELIIGKKGSGKSTDITKKALAIKRHPTYIYYDKDYSKNFFKNFRKARWHIYSNMPLNIPDLEYTLFDGRKLGDFYPMEHSVLFLDEINLLWDNRQFKEFKPSTQEFFRTNRKARVKCYLYSQTFDTDKKVRSLVDRMTLCRNFMGIFTMSRQISKIVTIKESALNADSQVVDNLQFAPFFLPGAVKFTFLPKYIKYHDSYTRVTDRPLLQDIRNIDETEILPI